jgi:hypothetical protein
MALTWKNVSTPQLRDFIGYDGDWKVARIMQPFGKGDWRWSVFAIIPAHADITHGHEQDPKEARRKVEAAWERAKAEGRRVGKHVQIENQALKGRAAGRSRSTSRALVRTALTEP